MGERDGDSGEATLSWQAVESLPDLERLCLVLDTLPDEEIVAALEARRGRGRNDYPVRSMWRALIAGVVFQHASIQSLLREMGRNPALLELCEFDPLPFQSAPVTELRAGMKEPSCAVAHPAQVRSTVKAVEAWEANFQAMDQRIEAADVESAVLVLAWGCEDLNTRGMTRSAKGTGEAPGHNVLPKAGLNRVILDTGWHGLRQMLGYKAGAVNVVNLACTSQTCAECGGVDVRSRRMQADFRCVACGHAANADVNAARNILASGTVADARGDCRVAGLANRETDRRQTA